MRIVLSCDGSVVQVSYGPTQISRLDEMRLATCVQLFSSCLWWNPWWNTIQIYMTKKTIRRYIGCTSQPNLNSFAKSGQTFKGKVVNPWHQAPKVQLTTQPEAHLQLLSDGNVNLVQGSFMITHVIQYSRKAPEGTSLWGVNMLSH